MVCVVCSPQIPASRALFKDYQIVSFFHPQQMPVLAAYLFGPLLYLWIGNMLYDRSYPTDTLTPSKVRCSVLFYGAFLNTMPEAPFLALLERVLGYIYRLILEKRLGLDEIRIKLCEHFIFIALPVTLEVFEQEKFG
jgi:hypothetical protein